MADAHHSSGWAAYVCRLYLLRLRSLYTHSTVYTQSLRVKLGALSISKLRRRARATRHGPSRTRRSAAEAIVALFADPLEDPLRSVHHASRRDALPEVGAGHVLMFRCA